MSDMGGLYLKPGRTSGLFSAVEACAKPMIKPLNIAHALRGLCRSKRKVMQNRLSMETSVTRAQ